MSTSGREAAELAATTGLVLDDWQRFALDVILSERSDGRWAAFEAALVVPRQNGKGSVIEALELAGLFLFGEKLILHSAHEFKTAAEGFLRVRSLIENTDDLRRKVARVRTSHGDEAIELTRQAGGGRLRFVARSNGSGRGFTGDRLILDEAYRLGANQMAALLPTLSARDNPQVVYTSSAPLADSSQLHAVRKRGLVGEPGRLAFLEWSVDPSVDADEDPAAWAKANPGLGIRIREEFVEAELAAMPRPEFRRERLGVPDAPAGELPPVFGAGNWEACLRAGSKLSGRLVFAVEVAHDRSAASIGVSDGRHVELVDRRGGTAWLAGRLVELDGKHRIGVLAVDPGGPAGSEVEELRRVFGGRLVELSSKQVSAAVGQMFDDVVDHKVRHIGQPDLDLAVGGALKRARGDAFVWDRRAEVDVAPLSAVTFAYGLAACPQADPLLAVW